MSTLFRELEKTATASPDKVAIVEGEQCYDYRTVLAATRRMALELEKRGVKRGDRVGLMLPNESRFVPGFFGIAKRGAVVLPLNPKLKATEIAAILTDGEATLVITSESTAELCREAAEEGFAADARPEVVAMESLGDLTELAASGQGDVSVDAAEPDDKVLYLYSSGSTGKPKRIARTHANIVFETQKLIERIGLEASDRCLGAAPFTHTNGLMRSMVASMVGGATLVPVAAFERRAVGRLIEKEGVTIFIGVPFMFAMLAETRWPKPVDLSSLRLCLSSSAPLRPETTTGFRDRYGISVNQLYGCTETGTISLNHDLEQADAIECVGQPLGEVIVDIFDDDRNPLAAGQHGDIGIRSPGATDRYPNAPEQTKTSFVNGYFFPGDVGYKDEDGRVYLVGRKSFFINRGGFKVNPYEIEGVLDSHPKVLESVVTGVETEYGDEKIKAIIVAAEAVDAAEIIAFCQDKVVDYKVPSLVEFRDALPKSSTGKVQRKAL